MLIIHERIYDLIGTEEEKKKALAEAAKDVSEEQLEAKELEEEEQYQGLLLKYKVEFKMMTEEEMQAI